MAFSVMEARTQFSVLVFLRLIIFSSCKDNITLNQSLTHNDLLVSKENNFALGFFRPGDSNSTYLGIWFHKVKVKAVVWIANRDNPITRSSSGILSINQRGNIVLFSDNNVNPVWSTNVSVKATDTLAARLLDTGNLVLILGDKILWQSFDHPTDTLLPGMKLGLNRISGMNWFLTSWKSANDPTPGDFSFKLNLGGSAQVVIYKGTKFYWRSHPRPWKIYHSYFLLTVVENEDEMYTTYYARNTSVISRVVLDNSGSLKWLTWHEEVNQWNEFNSVPKDRCDFYGLCGGNSKCDSNTLNKFECNCLPGYEPRSPKDWNLRVGSGGCIRKRLNSSSVCGHGEGFLKVKNVQVPDASTAVLFKTSTTPLECEKRCKINCSCSAYASIDMSWNGTSCLTWYGDLFDTRNYLGDTGNDLYVRVDALELAERARGSSNVFGKKGMLTALILSVVSAWFVLTIILTKFWLRMRKRKGTRTINNRRKKRSFDSISGSKYLANEIEEESRSHSELAFFNLNTIHAVTDNFSPSNKIGQGGFGTVFKGKLADGQEIAVKRMSKKSKQGVEEFKNEAMLIAKLQHRNLVKLLGFCIQKKEQMLIYEYMPNKSLDSFIFDETRKLILDWGKRFDIIMGIARGILYLHQDSRLRIIHRDLKSSNILLDAELDPKISDFGMAIAFHNEEIQGKTNKVVGTYGYMSPEYAVFGKYSVKSDVFSFGVILLEIISGQKNNGFHQDNPFPSMIGQVWTLWNEDRALEIVDTSFKGSYDSHEALRCIQVGLLCVQVNAMDRPTMLEVVLMLKSENALPSPKQPAFIFRETSSSTNSHGGKEGAYSINEMTITEILTR